MIPSSFKKILLFTIFMAYTITGMERPSGFVSSGKTPNPTPLSQSASMAFPAAKRDSSFGASLRGSMIKAIGRTTSLLSIGRDSSSSQMEPAPIPAAAAATTATPPKLQESIELIYNKPLYTILYDGQRRRVSIEGSCLAQYQVNYLKDFKQKSAYLQRPEILFFINTNLQPFNEEIKALTANMGTDDRQRAAKKAFTFLKKYRKEPNFNAPFYVVRLEDGDRDRVCVFEMDITEIQK